MCVSLKRGRVAMGNTTSQDQESTWQPDSGHICEGLSWSQWAIPSHGPMSQTA